jgi:hypothetical protein
MNHFDPETHSYFNEDKRMTGITSIIGVLAKPQLIGWASRVCAETVASKWIAGKSYDQPEIDAIVEEAKGAHQKKKEKAGEHGTDTHAIVEIYVNACLEMGGKPIVFEATQDAEPIKQFIDWAEENVDHFLFSERIMYDNERMIAGTADFAYISKDGKRMMGDFKTSSGIYGIDYWLQVSAYKMLAEGEGGEPYDGMTVVRLGKDGKFEVQSLYEYETYRDAFLACLTLYRAQASIKDLVIK